MRSAWSTSAQRCDWDENTFLAAVPEPGRPGGLVVRRELVSVELYVALLHHLTCVVEPPEVEFDVEPLYRVEFGESLWCHAAELVDRLRMRQLQNSWS